MNDSNLTNKPNGSGLLRILKATHCSIKGFKAAWSFEAAFRQEALLALILLPFTFVLAQSSMHWLALMFTLLFLLFAELVNSALEALADKVCLEHDPLIGRAKDIGSAIVFIAIWFLILVWCVAIYEYLANY